MAPSSITRIPAGRGQAILFSHGLFWDTSLFAPQIAALKSRYRCVAYDHRGQGRSARAICALSTWTRSCRCGRADRSARSEAGACLRPVNGRLRRHAFGRATAGPGPLAPARSIPRPLRSRPRTRPNMPGELDCTLPRRRSGRRCDDADDVRQERAQRSRARRRARRLAPAAALEPPIALARGKTA